MPWLLRARPPNFRTREEATDGGAPTGVQDANLDDIADLDDIAGLAKVDLQSDGEVPDTLRRGAAVIRHFWQHAPAGPGVYRMIGADGEVLYVGKAKASASASRAICAPGGHTNRIARMIALTASMVFVSTGPRPRRCFWRPITSSR